MIYGLPERLRELRKKSGFSQRQLAAMIDVSPSIISGYETGERTPSTEALLALSNIYHCSTDYLLGKQQAAPGAVLNADGLNAEQLQALQTIVAALKKKDQGTSK